MARIKLILRNPEKRETPGGATENDVEFDGSNAAVMLSRIAPEHRAVPVRSEGIRLNCDDGHQTILGKYSALLTGKSPARNVILSASLTNSLALGGSVVALTASRGDSPVVTCAQHVADDYGCPVRTISRNSGTPGFMPFAGWSLQNVQDFLFKKVGTAYVGHATQLSEQVRMCLVELMRLVPVSEEVARLVMRGVGNVRRLLDACEQAPLPRDVLDEMAVLFRDNAGDCIQAGRILGDFMRTFEPVCVPGTRQTCYNLFSPGLTILRMSDQNAQEQATLPWYICQMAGMLNDLAYENVTLLVDHVSQNVLNAFSGMLLNEDIRLLVVCDNYMGFGDADFRNRINGRFVQQFVFTQQTRDAAEYWSGLSGQRKVLMRSYGDHQGDSVSFLQPITHSRSANVGYQEQYRPALEVNHFTRLRPGEGELVEINSYTGQVFHHFYVDFGY